MTRNLKFNDEDTGAVVVALMLKLIMKGILEPDEVFNIVDAAVEVSEEQLEQRSWMDLSAVLLSKLHNKT